MAKYQLATLDWLFDVRLETTDPYLIDWLLAELWKHAPGYKVKTSARDLTGETYSVSLDTIRYDAVWWIIKQLCHQGWEPFETIKTREPTRVKGYCFRKQMP